MPAIGGISARNSPYGKITTRQTMFFGARLNLSHRGTGVHRDAQGNLFMAGWKRTPCVIPVYPRAPLWLRF